MITASELRKISFSPTAQKARKRKLAAEEKLNREKQRMYARELKRQVRSQIKLVKTAALEAAHRGETAVEVLISLGRCNSEDVYDGLREYFRRRKCRVSFASVHDPESDARTHSVCVRWEEDYEPSKK